MQGSLEQCIKIRVSNRDIKWEKTESTNISIHFTFSSKHMAHMTQQIIYSPFLPVCYKAILRAWIENSLNH